MVFAEWNDQFELGVASMDSAHREFIQLLDRLNAVSMDGLPSLFAMLVEHTAQHFEQENRLMEVSAFPMLAIHREEHEYVLNILRETLRNVEAGDVTSGHVLAGEMLAWFEQHAASMDLALARHIETSGFPAD